jgi:hypothetical protein
MKAGKSSEIFEYMNILYGSWKRVWDIHTEGKGRRDMNGGDGGYPLPFVFPFRPP